MVSCPCLPGSVFLGGETFSVRTRKSQPHGDEWVSSSRLKLTNCLHQSVLIKVGGEGVLIRVSRGAGSGEGGSGSRLPYPRWFDSLTTQVRKPKRSKVADLAQVAQTGRGRMQSPTMSSARSELFALLCPSFHSLCLPLILLNNVETMNN